MKVIFVILALALPMAAQAKTVKGLRADALLNAGGKLDIVEGSMGGRYDMEIKNVVCEKSVTETEGHISCAFRVGDDDAKGQKSIDTEGAIDLRQALRELVGEIEIGKTAKLITVQSIKCHSAGAGHELDAIEIERTSTCWIK
jgi:hypothetical protein